MTSLPGVIVTGASGRMGRMLLQTVAESSAVKLVGAIERHGNEFLGQDVGTLIGRPDMGVTITDDPLPAFAKAQAVLDFTAPSATVEFAAPADARPSCLRVAEQHRLAAWGRAARRGGAYGRPRSGA